MTVHEPIYDRLNVEWSKAAPEPLIHSVRGISLPAKFGWAYDVSRDDLYPAFAHLSGLGLEIRTTRLI